MVNFRLPGRPLTAGARPIAGHLSRTLLLVATAAGLAVPLTFASAAQSYVIQPGDTLSGIANRYGVDVASLALQNGIENINLIRYGETLIIGGGDADAPASAEAKTHVVQPGETLSSIAAMYGMDLYDLAIANGLTDVDLVYVGQELVISDDPPTQRHENYTVQPGDSLAAIADKFNVLVRDLVDFNGIKDPDHILAGQVLEIPASRTEVPAYWVSREEAETALKNAEAEYGLPSGLLQALAWQESGWQQHVISDAGAVGLTQLLPSTAEWALEWLAPTAVDWHASATDNANMGAAILAHWLHLADGDIAMALAAYYQGWHSVETQGVFEETKQYIANVVALMPQFAD